MATAAGAQTIGRKKIVRYAERPLSLRFKRTASSMAMAIENGTCTSVYLIVFHRDCHISAEALPVIMFW